MHVEIEHHTASGRSEGLETPDGDGDVVEDAEAFSSVREGMVCSAGQVRRRSLFQSRVRCRDRATHGAARALDELGRPGKADPPNLVTVE